MEPEIEWSYMLSKTPILYYRNNGDDDNNNSKLESFLTH